MAAEASKNQEDSFDKEVRKLTEYAGELSCTAGEGALSPPPGAGAELAAHEDAALAAKWPKLNTKVPIIFLHKTADFATHVKDVLGRGIKFYQPYLSPNYTKIACATFEDHLALVQYFEERGVPHHTFGPPSGRTVRAVVRGLPPGAQAAAAAQALRQAGVPVLRAAAMRARGARPARGPLLLVVVPAAGEGRALLRLRRLLGADVRVEPLRPRAQQCHRCQRWGHAQRHCRGAVRCVRCAGEHWSRDCPRPPRAQAQDQPTCANCGGAHAASFRHCFHCPDAPHFRLRRRPNEAPQPAQSAPKPPAQPRLIVTQHIADNNLYKKINNIPKHAEAIPF